MCEPILKFDPSRGTPATVEWTARAYRKATLGRTWFYNPYTGTMRNRLDVSSDPVGFLIVPEGVDHGN